MGGLFLPNRAMSTGSIQPYCPADLKSLLVQGDIFIAQFIIKDDNLASKCVLTAKSAFFCDATNTPKWSKAWLEAYAVSAVGETKLSFAFLDLKKNSKTPTDSRIISLETRTQRDLWVIVMRRLMRDAHQAYFESRWVQAPDVFQLQRLCLKYTSKGKRTQIIVVVSTGALFLFGIQGKNTIVPKELLGTCPLTGISSIVSHSNCDELVTVVGSSSLLGGTGKIDVNVILRFFTSEDAKWFVRELSRVYFLKNKSAPKTLSRKLSRTDSISKGIKGGFQ